MRGTDSDGTGGGLDRSICPGVSVPATVLMAVMNDGNYLLVGYPQGAPSAYVTAEDAVPLQAALAAAFGSEQSATASRSKNGSI